MSGPGQAVFLSYASEDAPAAKRICDALRAAGVEVWFDQNELVGGDQWDAKIRKQIKECALLIPIISQNTQARTEGYFRLEWRLADQRTHLMAKGRPFLLPVVTDDTRDADAHVPDSFTEVQWTKAPAGDVPAAFAARVQKLLSGEQGARSAEQMSVAPVPRRGPSRWWWALPVFGVTMALLLVMKEGRHEQRPVVTAPAPESEARRLAGQARELLLKPSGGPSKYETAVLLCDRALVLDPTDAEVWAIASQVDTNVVRQSFDPSEKRVASAQSKAAQAINLDPRSFEARLALAAFQAMIGGPPVAAEGESVLRALHAENPRELRVLYALIVLLRHQGRGEEAVAFAEEASRLPGGAVTGLNQKAWALRGLGRFDEADAALDQSIALEPIAGNIGLKVFLDLGWRGDPERALATIRKLPAEELTMDVGVAAAVRLYRWRREPAELLKFLAAVPRDWLPWSIVGPKAALTGDANAELNRPDAARADWQSALALVAQRLAATPNDRNLLEWKAYLEASLGEAALAQATWRRSKEAPAYLASLLTVEKIQRVAAPDQVLDELEQRVKDVLGNLAQRRDSYGVFISAAELRLDPAWDSIRNLPRFQALQTRLDADPRFSPAAKALPAGTPPGTLAVDDKSVAVLAFANLSDDKANEYFSDGISEELLNVLAKIPGLKVTARTSAFYFKGKEVPVPEIARQLGVAYVVEGSVRKQGEKVRITAQLIKAADGFHVWSDTFTRELKDIFAVQDEIAGLIAQNLEVKIWAASPTAAVNAEAFDAYLKGRRELNLQTAESEQKAEEYFTRAIASQSDFALAYVGLADVWLGRYEPPFDDFPRRNVEKLRRIESRLEQARLLDPRLPEIQVSWGNLARTRWLWSDAEQHFHQAIQLNPNYARGHAGRARNLMLLGQVDEALVEMRFAVTLDPLATDILSSAGKLFVEANQPEEAREMADRALAANPASVQAFFIKLEALLALGRREEALGMIHRRMEQTDSGTGLLHMYLAPAGERKQTEHWIAEQPPDSNAYLLVRGYLEVGRTAEARQALQADRMIPGVLESMFYLPVFDQIRNTPEFARVLEEAGLVAAHARAQAWRAAH